MPSETPESIFSPHCGMFPYFEEPCRSRSAGAAGEDLQGFTSVLERGSTKTPARNVLAEQIPDRMKTSTFFLWVHFLEVARWNPRSLWDGVCIPTPHDAVLRCWAAVSVHHRIPWIHTEHGGLQALSSQCHGTHISYQALGRKKYKLHGQRPAAEGPGWPLGWDVGTVLSLRLPSPQTAPWCCPLCCFQ